MRASSRHVFFVAGVVLAVLACLRLLVLLGRPGDAAASVNRRLDAEISLRVQGGRAPTLRLHMPELPLNIDVPYTGGEVTVPVSLAVRARPKTVIVQLVDRGRVVAASRSLPLGEGARVQLGQVEVQAP